MDESLDQYPATKKIAVAEKKRSTKIQASKKDKANKVAIAELTGAVSDLKRDLIQAHYSSNFNPLFHIGYDGEKNEGELGVLTKYRLEYEGLRHRSWKAYLDDEIARTIIDRYVMWMIGDGLEFQSEPVQSILEGEGINLNIAEFTKAVEDRFKVYGDSPLFDYKGTDNLNQIAKTVYTNAIVGGDVLVIPRVIKGNLNVELIDGAHIKNPPFGDEQSLALDRGNIIKNGIEQNKKGEHIAYWVQKRGTFHEGFESDLEFKRIPARTSITGRKNAFLVYGLRYRIDDNRGIPILSTILETLKKLDRYKEAIVASAEERAKIVLQIVHKEFSSGDNPLGKNLARALNQDSDQDVAVDALGKQLADKVAVTTNKSTYNMPPGAEMKAISSDAENVFKDFYNPNVNFACAAIGIPPEVALSKYDSNFSSSRAALKDWEHTLKVERKAFAVQFYKPLFDYWLELEISKGKIIAPGFIVAMFMRDHMVLGAYRAGRFIGSNVPHIDPEKEARAERIKLGPLADHLPMTTLKKSTEALSGGDAMQNLKKFAIEILAADDLALAPAVPEPVLNEPNNEE